MLGFIMGGAIACGYVVVRFLMDDKFRTADDIRKYTGLTTLAAVPVDDSETMNQSARRKHEKR